jgi:hypothetical protein
MAAMRPQWFRAAVLPLIFAPVATAAAEEGCAERERVLEFLSEHYQETPVAMGVANNGGLIEVVTTPDGATWTILITMPDGDTCMVAAGHDWERLPSAVQSAEAEPDPEA